MAGAHAAARIGGQPPQPRMAHGCRHAQPPPVAVGAMLGRWRCDGPACAAPPAAKRHCAARAAAEDVDASRGGGALELSTASFHTVALADCEFLFASHAGGKVDLNDVYVKDEETGIFARPAVEGQLPDRPHSFVEMEWAEEYHGDTLMNKPAWRKVHKVFLVRIEQEDPFRVDLEEVYSVDNAARVLRREAVTRLTEETDPTLITLRLRADGLLIERNEDMMSDWDLVEAWHVEEERQRVATAIAAMDGAPAPLKEEDEGARDPIESLNDDEREYDENFEDTPEVDQGYGE